MIKAQATVKVKNSAGVEIATQVYDKVCFEGLALDEKGKPTFDASTPDLVNQNVSKMLSDAIAFYQQQRPNANPVVELLADATYAYDLGVRAGIRQQLVTAAAGPDKAIEKAVKDLMAARAAAGKPITEEQARAKVQVMMAD